MNPAWAARNHKLTRPRYLLGAGAPADLLIVPWVRIMFNEKLKQH